MRHLSHGYLQHKPYLEWENKTLATIPGILGISNQVSIFLKQMAISGLGILQYSDGGS